MICLTVMCMRPVTAIIITVLPTEAATMGSHSSAIMPRQFIRPTPAGTKKNPRLCTRKLASRSTCRGLIRPARSDAARRSIPIMLDGTGMSVAQTINSPTARKNKMTPNCSIMLKKIKKAQCVFHRAYKSFAKLAIKIKTAKAAGKILRSDSD